jgi:hypothetical protein
MTDLIAAAPVAQGRCVTVPFHGANLYVVEHNGEPVVPMRPVAEGIGLAWQPQHRKLNDGRFRACVTELVTQLPGDAQRRTVTAMPLRKLTAWLMTIEPGKVKDLSVRARVIQYQDECDDVLWQYWANGAAINPRAFVAGPGDLLTDEEQGVLRAIVKQVAQRLPKEKQAGATIKLWSKLKSHYGVPYRQIPREEFAEAVSLLTRASTEWELMEEPQVKPHVALNAAEATELAALFHHSRALRDFFRCIEPGLDVMRVPGTGDAFEHAKHGSVASRVLAKVEKQCVSAATQYLGAWQERRVPRSVAASGKRA